RDGLIVTRGKRRGLLLPQVPVEQGRNWDVLAFLENTCQKAWLPPDSWKDVKNTKIERFTATIFEESSPKGEIHQKEIGE
ncbi:MAG: AMMECR1 domain-containing protein, partial [Promethearchaeota archaeon]